MQWLKEDWVALLRRIEPRLSACELVYFAEKNLYLDAIGGMDADRHCSEIAYSVNSKGEQQWMVLELTRKLVVAGLSDAACGLV